MATKAKKQKSKRSSKSKSGSSSKAKKQKGKRGSSSKASSGVKSIEKEIQQLGKDVDAGKLRGEAMEDAAEVIEGKVKVLAREGKITPEQVREIKDKLKRFDD